MKLTVREMLSLTLGLGGIALLGLGMSHILDTGTCGSGGPHAIARECPEGSGVWGVLLPVGFFVWFVGLFVSKGGLVKPGAGQVIWTVGFAGGGLALLLKAFTQSSLGPGSSLGIYIMASIFIPLGVAIWIPTAVRFLRRRRTGPGSQQTDAEVGGHASRPVGRTEAAGDRRARRKQLNELRSSGALTRAEFDRLKGDQAAPVLDGSHEPAGDRLALIQQLAALKASGILTTEEFEAKKRTVMLGDSARPGRRPAG
jgi:hypothetical protein